MVHFDVRGPDPAPLKEFYTQLFGWGTQETAGGYHLVDTNGGDGINGGIGTTPDGSVGTIVYAQAHDLQEVLDRAERLGGKVAMPVTKMEMVTFAMIADPDGLIVGVVQSDQEGQQQGPSKGDGAPVDWFEILGTDATRTQAFYNDLFGWKGDDTGFPGYAMMDEKMSGIAGGLGSGDDSTWAIPYAQVADAGAALDKADPWVEPACTGRTTWVRGVRGVQGPGRQHLRHLHNTQTAEGGDQSLAAVGRRGAAGPRLGPAVLRRSRERVWPAALAAGCVALGSAAARSAAVTCRCARRGTSLAY